VELNYLRSHPYCVAVSGAVKYIDEQGGCLGTVQRLPQPDRADPRGSAGDGGYRCVYYSEDTDLCWSFQGREAMKTPLGKYRVYQQRPHYGIGFAIGMEPWISRRQ
jgi:hypothetical protein